MSSVDSISYPLLDSGRTIIFFRIMDIQINIQKPDTWTKKAKTIIIMTLEQFRSVKNNGK